MGTTPKKKHEINLHTTNPEEESHTNIIPPLTTKITGSSNYFSIILLNINGLNSSIQRHKLTDWMCKQGPAFCCIQETHLSDKNRYFLKVIGWNKFQANGPKKISWGSHSNIG